MKKFLVLAVFGLLFFAGCYKDSVDSIYPGKDLFVPCDTTTHPHFNANIVPLLTNYCYTCHQGSGCVSGYPFDTYAQLKTQADNGNLYGCINYLHGFNPMPQNLQLDTCNLNLLNRWIADGAPQ
ncbi:MAG TPA: hypothetical protein VL651_08980 [Bacteroidia bacterium]|jgi:hypothetical protein|nr:hypothetical protein [Bacteroidia bacterium]